MGDTLTCPANCECHNGPYYECNIPGGCGSEGCGQDNQRCNAGEHCAAKERVGNHTVGAPTNQPLCDLCIEHAGRDIRALVLDYLDLAQLHETSLSQAISEKTAGSKEKQMLIVGHVEALQAEIVHVATTWEYEVRVAARLSDPYVAAPVADWHTTISKPTPLAKVRPGAAVQRAVGIIYPRVRFLSQIPATAVCRTGVEDDPGGPKGFWGARSASSGSPGNAGTALPDRRSAKTAHSGEANPPAPMTP
jgi:hypothetical protein